MIFLLAIVCLVYVPVMGWLLAGAYRLPRFKAEEMPARTKFSIVIPFRNEAQNLPRLLKSLQALEYARDRFEVLLVNDASEDASLAIIEEFMALTSDSAFDLKILQNKRTSNAPKKDAITTAVGEARYEWIVTTDSDCELPVQWLKLYDNFIQKKQPKMVCAPVVYPNGKGALKGFQVLDGLSLQLVTMGGFGWKQPLLANGANLGYLKSVFLQVNGYEGNRHIASGDDIFLLEKVRQHYPGSVHYLKHPDAAVLTQPEGSWRDVIAQRIRWASKTSKQAGGESTFLGVIVFIGNLAFVMAFILLAVTPDIYEPFLVLIGIKTLVDLVLLSYSGIILKKPFSMLDYVVNAFIYPVLTIWVVLNSFWGRYQWKGRNFKK